MPRVELSLCETAGVARRNWPVTQGIPFADGTLPRGAKVRLMTEDGTPLPVQTRCLATWHADQRYVKWLLIDFQIALTPRQERKLILETVDAESGANSDISEARHDFCPLSPILYFSDQHGRRFESASVSETVIEDQGTRRTSVCIRGRHVASDGTSGCPYALRMHHFAGSRDVRVQHTFIFDLDPEMVELSQIGVRFNLPEGQYAVAAIRDADKLFPKAVDIRAGEIDVKIWPKQEGRTINFRTPFTRKECVFFGGTRDEAEFQRLIEAKPGAPLNLKSTGAQTRDDLEWVERMVSKYAPDRAASYNDTGMSDGFGAAVTTEFWIRLSPDPITDAEGFARAVNEPLLAFPSPAYIASTGAARMCAPFDPNRHAEAESMLKNLFQRVVAEPREILKNYGMWDYGDLMCSHSASPAAIWSMFKDSPDIVERMKWCSRAYNNEANDQVNALWGFFLHFGEREHYLAAEAYGRHMADVDIIHAGKDRGLMHYHNAHHWSGEPSPSHTCMAGLMLQYYLTGDKRIFDVCTEIAGWALAQHEPCGIHSNRNGKLIREFTTPVANLLEYYQATWDQRYGEMARRSLKWMLLAMPEPGAFPQSIYTSGKEGEEAEVEQDGWHIRHAGGMTPQLLYDATRLFGEDPIYADCLIGLAKRYLTGPESPFETMLVGEKGVARLDPFFNAPVMAYAYELTKDAALAAFCRYYVEHHFPRRAREMSFTFVCWGSIIPAMMEAVRRAESELGVAAIDRAEKVWIADVEKARSESGVIQTPRAMGRRSLGVIRGYLPPER